MTQLGDIMKNLILAVFFAVSGSGIYAEELVNKLYAEEVMFRGKVISSKLLRDSDYVLLIRFDEKFYQCLITADHKQCVEIGQKTLE